MHHLSQFYFHVYILCTECQEIRDSKHSDIDKMQFNASGNVPLQNLVDFFNILKLCAQLNFFFSYVHRICLGLMAEKQVVASTRQL